MSFTPSAPSICIIASWSRRALPLHCPSARPGQQDRRPSREITGPRLGRVSCRGEHRRDNIGGRCPQSRVVEVSPEGLYLASILFDGLLKQKQVIGRRVSGAAGPEASAPARVRTDWVRAGAFPEYRAWWAGGARPAASEGQLDPKLALAGTLVDETPGRDVFQGDTLRLKQSDLVV